MGAWEISHHLFYSTRQCGLKCQPNVTDCQDKQRLRDYLSPRLILFSLLCVSAVDGVVRGRMKIIEQAKYFKSGETVRDRGTQFIIKEVRVSTNDGGIVFIDMEGFGHGTYHPDEYLGVGG